MNAPTAPAFTKSRGGAFDTPNERIDTFLDRLDTLPESLAYYEVAEPLRDWMAQMGVAHDAMGAEDLARTLLKRSLGRQDARLARLPTRIQALVVEQNQRIIRNISEQPYGFYDPTKDMFLKDFGLARLTLIPAGTQLADLTRGPGKRFAAKGGWRQFSHFSHLLFRRPLGLSPLFEIHTHDQLLGDFNESSRERCYLHLVDLLSLVPEAKGIYGSSWFYDPVVSTISPRLSYLRETPVKHGAYLFYVNPDNSGNAIATSPTRREHYEAGRYQPRKFLMIWHRDDMFRWAKSYRT